MILKKKYFIFLAVLLVAMMSVAVAADVNDSTTESITPAVTHTTDNTDVQTATPTSNKITIKLLDTEDARNVIDRISSFHIEVTNNEINKIVENKYYW